ncbi:hypothetical protein D3C73_1374130 [compost metagenome]
MLDIENSHTEKETEQQYQNANGKYDLKQAGNCINASRCQIHRSPYKRDDNGPNGGTLQQKKQGHFGKYANLEPGDHYKEKDEQKRQCASRYRADDFFGILKHRFPRKLLA